MRTRGPRSSATDRSRGSSRERRSSRGPHKGRTDEGDKWYRLGDSLEPADVRPGNYIEFDYADDTIETISTTPGDNNETSKTEQVKKP